MKFRTEVIRYSIKVIPLVLLVLCVYTFHYFSPSEQANDVQFVNRVLLERVNRSDTEASVITEEVVERCRVPRSGDVCGYVKESCAKTDGYINYLSLYYCSMKNVEWLAWIFFVVWIVFIFYVLGSTAEEFFCPALMKISKKLHLSPNIAGVTFLALGNGSPDIFSSFVGINSGLFPQAIGELMGAGLFVSSVVVGAVLLVSTVEVKPPRRPFVRDVLFFLGAVLLIMIALFDHEVTLVESLLLVGYYIIYVSVVLVGRWVYQQRKKQKLKNSGEVINETEEEAQTKVDSTLLEGESITEIISPEEPLIPKNTYDSALPTYLPKVGIIEEKGRITLDKRHAKLMKRWSSRQVKRLYSYRRNIKQYFEWDRMDGKDTILFVALLPLTIMRHFTIPWMAEGKYLRLFCVMYPLTISMFCWLLLEGWKVYVGQCPLWGVILAVGGACSLLFFFITERNPRRPPRYYSVFALVGLIMSVVWIYIAATELVAVLEAVGQILGVSNAIMGLTVLAWGNSVSDTLSNSIISRKGFPQMALGACYAAPLCNMLLGLGIAWTFYIIKTGHPFILSSPDELPNTVFFAVVLLIGNLVCSLAIVAISKFKLPKSMGFVLILFYATFTILGLLSEFGVILKGTHLFWSATSTY